ncbi:hypothetical protein NM688_g7076 [Phlebia brevispora]|uniref:Uncharacterized protein n=1 Tax=Phlebia brevispora TaxID=194682 RepID=A0ACC1S9C6_9APHY|nr:hypothetical protein NM688_g7076 [Phlebia brevispora]
MSSSLSPTMSLTSLALESMAAVASATPNFTSPLLNASLADSPDTGPPVPLPTPSRHVNAVVGFMIGLGIVTLASIMNAAGLNLTKLDHVRTSAIPKASRRKDWLRPLWLLGMILYILSQLIGSTLALEYMRAEYVAPLGSTSLIFNFLFAKFLVNTPNIPFGTYNLFRARSS